jgi:N-glycosylase/DNA lyase
MRDATESDVFKELCFCILTANFSAERGIALQKRIGNGFLTLPERRLAGLLKRLGYRFPNTRARYIVEARAHKRVLRSILRYPSNEAREWLAQNVPGIGYKEASHFLRNVGRTDVAILDFHVLDHLARHRIIKRPKTLTKKRYIGIEHTMERIARRAGLSLAELDLCLWFAETGKILK